MLTEKDYCDYDTCVALEELGFPIRRIKVKGEEKHVPVLLYEAQKFLREEKKCFINIFFVAVDKWLWEIDIIYPNGTGRGKVIKLCKSYEEALLEGVRASIKILQDEQKENN